MSNVLLVILLIISVIMTGLILIQRSEGGALGIGGGGGGFMSGRAATTSIARMTAILGTVFLVLSLLLSVVFAREFADTSRIDVDGEVGGLTSAPERPDTTTPLETPSVDDAEAQTDPADTDE